MLMESDHVGLWEPPAVAGSISGLKSDLEESFARQGPPDAKNQVAPDGLRSLLEEGSTSVKAAVVVGDLRMSGLLIREAVSAPLFARYIIGFTEAVRGLATSFEGWFDKFTGDGFITFWLYQDEDELLDSVPAFCQSVIPASEALIDNLKQNSRNFPVGVGLAIGIDAGPCELVRVGDALTLVGSPIVGASRMVSGARAGQSLVNVGLGTTFERHRDRLEAAGVRLAKHVVPTKEYPEGQEAFRMEFSVGLPKLRVDEA